MKKEEHKIYNKSAKKQINKKFCSCGIKKQNF